MNWLVDKRIKRLQRELDEARMQLKASEERLAAERAVNSGLDAALDEALEVIHASDETLTRQHALIESLKDTVATYQEMVDKQAKPLCEGILALLGRDHQAAFVLDEQ